MTDNKALAESIRNYLESGVDLLLTDDDYKVIIEALEQESKAGHWIMKDSREQGYDIGGIKTWYVQVMCDKCGFIKTAIEGHTAQYKYCPNCGAKMEVRK